MSVKSRSQAFTDCQQFLADHGYAMLCNSVLSVGEPSLTLQVYSNGGRYVMFLIDREDEVSLWTPTFGRRVDPVTFSHELYDLVVRDRDSQEEP